MAKKQKNKTNKKTPQFLLIHNMLVLKCLVVSNSLETPQINTGCVGPLPSLPHPRAIGSEWVCQPGQCRKAEPLRPLRGLQETRVATREESALQYSCLENPMGGEAW